ncbi:MAG: BrnT family toxin [Candidatus Sumerlaeota bacterium]|nr:BrnT family toxin [Candidatus Sumerlaeota bacterium]
MFSFEWSAEKERQNWAKHRVSFDEATSVFQDPLASIFDDEDHSWEEKREIIIGLSVPGRLLVVSFCETARGSVRIISARRASKREQKDYEECYGV